MGTNTQVWQYVKAYQWSDMLAMARNNKADPRQCSDGCSDRLVVITGATSGIGYATARTYASRGASLLCINRNVEKSRELCDELTREFGVRCRDIIADLSRLDDMHRVGHQLSQLCEPIDILIHNAGTYLTRRVVTADGLDTVFAVNYLSSFVINTLLLDKLRSQSHGRVLLVNSEAHRFAPWGLHLDDLCWEQHRYSGLRSYGSAKLAQLLAMQTFVQLLSGCNVTVNAMHPGAVRTESGKENGALYKWYKNRILERNFRSATISADALYYLGVSAEIEGVSGKFFNLTTLENPAPPALDRAAAEKLREVSLALGRLDDPLRSSAPCHDRESARNPRGDAPIAEPGGST
ncbi:MAG: SDR family NAD(P)-dependent oxidoreductase [Spirochaetaceae bacterium]|nr:MAG: SDR family NAD(P)-dependent oxidoreductase [Spirochaetaceae bacterium]